MTTRYLLRRIGFMVIVWFVAITFNFIIPRIMPGDIIDIYTQGKVVPEEALQATIQRFGLDKSYLEQFGIYIKNIFTGNWGVSFYYYPSSVWERIRASLPYSYVLLHIAMFLSMPLGYFMGIFTGWNAGGKRDFIVQVTSLGIGAMPMFWLAMIMLYVFAFRLGWFPLAGAYTVGAVYPNWFAKVLDYARHGFLPVMTLIAGFGATQLVMRNTMVRVLRESYILTAEAKGLTENRIKYMHAARNAMLPMVTGIIMRITMIVGGNLFIERIFSYPGVGRLMFNSIVNQDYPMLQAAWLVNNTIAILVILLVDILYMRLDPRIRYSRG
ncbi:ABC transporter permease [Chloroflexota bacterium]